MSTLSGGIGAQHLTAGESSSSLVQSASSDPVDVIRAPKPSQTTSRRRLSTWFGNAKYVISGITRDSSGNPLGGVTVFLFNSSGGGMVLRSDVTGGGVIVTDANGAYGFEVNDLTVSQIVAYKAGAPDVTGATVNTLVGS